LQIEVVGLEGDYDMACIYNLFGHLHKKAGTYIQATYYYHQAQKILKRICPQTSESLVYERNLLKSLLFVQEKPDQGIYDTLPLDSVRNFVTPHSTYLADFSLRRVYSDSDSIFLCVSGALRGNDYHFASEKRKKELISPTKKLVYTIIKENIEKFDIIRDLNNMDIDEFESYFMQTNSPNGLTCLKAFSIYYKIEFWVYEIEKKIQSYPRIINTGFLAEKKVFIFIDKTKDKPIYCYLVAKYKENQTEVSIFGADDKFAEVHAIGAMQKYQS